MANLALSQMRAVALQHAVAAAVPIACDESPIRRQLNRSVGVWLRPSTGSAAP